jgi:Domain of unknown function (DUF4288)
MAYVPKDVEWFLAGLVEEIRVAGSKRNIVHINYVIIRARSPEAAYKRALRIGGRGATTSYENPHGKMVTLRFRGLESLDIIYEPLGDECEVMYREKLGVIEKGIRRMVRPKDKLEVFRPIRGRPGRPDFSSKEILDEWAESVRKKR